MWAKTAPHLEPPSSLYLFICGHPEKRIHRRTLEIFPPRRRTRPSVPDNVHRRPHRHVARLPAPPPRPAGPLPAPAARAPPARAAAARLRRRRLVRRVPRRRPVRRCSGPPPCTSPPAAVAPSPVRRPGRPPSSTASGRRPSSPRPPPRRLLFPRERAPSTSSLARSRSSRPSQRKVDFSRADFLVIFCYMMCLCSYSRNLVHVAPIRAYNKSNCSSRDALQFVQLHHVH